MKKSGFWLAVFHVLLSVPFILPAQDKSVLVERCKALDQSSPIHNIWVDKDNIKWIANGNGLNKVLALDYVEKVNVPPGTTSLLMIRGGNANIEWNTNDVQQLLGGATITCGFYNPATETVWIGTREAGAFEIDLSPLRVVQRLNKENKLTSNRINDIFIRQNGVIFIATNDGMLTGTGDKWTLQERYLNFVGVDAWGDNLWILGDNFLWQVDSRGKWTPIAIELKNVEGPIRDIAVDDEGRVWIASNMMTGYDVAADKYQRFGPGQYFTSQFVNCLDVDKDGSIWTGTDDKGLYLIQWESSLILTISQDNAMDCLSDNPTAALSVKVAGGQPPYMYAWSNGLATSSITKVPAGKYSITVTDAQGLTKTGEYTVHDPRITASIQQISPATGNDQNGSATVSANGGSGQYIYAWDNGEYTETAVRLGPGSHSVTVTDKSGCSAVATISVEEKFLPLTSSITVLVNNLCATAKNGEMRADVKGGKPPYTYAWNSQTGKEQSISGLSSGTYFVTVTDAAGQSSSATATLNTPPAVMASIELLQQASVNTNDGQAQVKASGGMPPYSFLWSNGETNAISKSLIPGTNAVTVTDANDCTAVATINMTENITALALFVSQNGEFKCHDQGAVELKAEVTGGKGPYSFSWNNDAKEQAIRIDQAGHYQVTVTDVSGKVATVSKEVTQPDPVVLTVQSEGAATTGMNNGKAIVRATGGAGAYDYLWDNGETSGRATKLTAGTHTVTVSDKSGCSAVIEIEIPENILPLQVNLQQTGEIKCAGQAGATLEAVVTGGKEPFAYAWSNQTTGESIRDLKDGLYSLTVTDAAGQTATIAATVDSPSPLQLKIFSESPASANNSDGRAVANVSGGTGKHSFLWDNGETNSRAEKLSAGQHTLVVTDENGCTVEGNFEMTENILPLTLEIQPSGEIACAGQKTITLTAIVTGGKEPYSYTWSGWHNGSIETLKDVGVGVYSLKVTDASGGSKTANYEVKEPVLLQVTAEKITPASTGNADGEVQLKVSGGKMPYSYNGAVMPNTNTINVYTLSPGPHTLVVMDAAGCSAEAEVVITEDILPLTASIKESKSILCTDASNGALEASAKGGKPPYTFEWNNGNTSPSITNIKSGNYQVIVRDASGQESKTEFALKAPAPVTVEIVNLRPATNDRIDDGKGSVEIKGGTPPYTYQWDSGETSMHASKLSLGTGTVVVTDANGCVGSAEYLVKEKVLPELTADRLASGEPIRMEKIQFQADSVKIEEEAIPSLDELYNFLYDNPTTIIEVAGHTNGLPEDDYCDRISSERAQSVANYLIEKGIEPRRVISKGYGKRKPIATNQTPEGRRKNQRVEIRLIKIEE